MTQPPRSKQQKVAASVPERDSGEGQTPASAVPYLQDPDVTLWHGDALDVLKTLPDASVDAVVTSPPYVDARDDVQEVPAWMWPAIFCELARVVTGGMLWNVGRIWRGGIERLWWLDLIRDAAFSGWEHWDTAVWIKPNANPIQGRVLANSHEYVLVFGRNGARFNEDALRTEYAASSIPRMRRKWINGRSVKGSNQKGRLVRPTQAHELGARARSYFVSNVGREKGNPHPTPMDADFCLELISLASWPGGVVLDPFAGSGTTCLVARNHGRHSIGIDLNEQYLELAATRLQQLSLLNEGALLSAKRAEF